MNSKLEINQLYSQNYRRMFKKFKDKKYKTRSDRISSCLDLWVWDKYELNKILDLKKINRCYNNRFCPNCKILDTAKFIHYIKPQIENLISDGYIPFLLTLTVPNVDGKILSKTLDKINYTFRKFFEKFNSDDIKYALQFRLIKIFGALKTLEITYNEKSKTFHPHIHCMIFLKDDEIDYTLLHKRIQGRYDYKTGSCNTHSFFEIQLMKVWSMMYKKVRVTEKNYNNYPDDPNDPKNLIVDLRPMNEKGIYEVIKYTVKDTDLFDYDVFEILVKTLENRRIRQTYGNLLDFDEDDFDVGNYQELELFIQENPVQIITQDIRELYTIYSGYTKISRFQPNCNLEETSKNVN